MPVKDLVLNVRGKLVVAPDFQVRPMYALALFEFPPRRVGAVYLAVHQLRRALDGQSALDLSIDGGIVDMKRVRDLLRFVALLQHLVDLQVMCHDRCENLRPLSFMFTPPSLCLGF